MRRHEGTLLLVLAALWIMASLAMGCATPRIWGGKRVLCRYAEKVTMLEFLENQDMKWEFREMKGKRIVCASKRLGGSRLGK